MATTTEITSSPSSNSNQSLTRNQSLQQASTQRHGGSSTSAIALVQNSSRKNVITIKPKVKRKVAELRSAEIRWFYKRKDDAKWVPFKGYDSTVLEVAYRRKKGLDLDESTIQLLCSLPENVIVQDGNYRADQELENIDAIYWKEDTFQIRRGTWFYADSIQPLPSDFADAVEAHHLHCFKGNVIPETPVFSESESSKKPELTTFKWHDEKVCWNSVVDVHIAPQKSGMVMRLFGRSRPVSLRRSYTDPADPWEGKPNFSDLILVVHGIGQKGYENLIAKNTAQMRDAINNQMDKYYPNEKRRPAILPIEWRSSLLLDNDMTDIVTLPRMPQARSALNSVCMDLMYYQSPLYRTEIVNGVIKCLNTVYTTFIENNPNFTGPISIIGHSLGSVITYDILTNWSPFLLYDKFVNNAIVEQRLNCLVGEQSELLEQFYNNRKLLLQEGKLLEQILVRQDEPLMFKVKYLFCLGSPLAVFLIMRGADYHTVVPKSENVQRIFNVFHPYDPVAYRLEPMFHENYRHIKPLKLFSYMDAIKSYENLILECHGKYLLKCKKRKKQELKDAIKSAKKEKQAAARTGNNDGKPESNNNKNGKTKQFPQQSVSLDDAMNEQDLFMDDTESDIEMASNSYTSTSVSTPRSMTPQNVCNSTSPQDSLTPSTLTTTPSTPLPPSLAPTIKSRVGNSNKLVEAAAVDAAKESTELEAEAEAAEEVQEEAEEPTEALPADDNNDLLKVTPLDDLKKMGEAGQLIEEIALERRISQRLDFQVQPASVFDNMSYWTMLKSHFSYWSNLDIAAFVCNAIYPPPLEMAGVVKLA